MDFILGALSYIGEGIASVIAFIMAIPDWVSELFQYAVFFGIKMWLEFKLMGIEFAHDIAVMLLKDYEVYTLISAAFNKMPDSLRFFAHNFGFVEALRIVVDGFVTGFILRITGW